MCLVTNKGPVLELLNVNSLVIYYFNPINISRMIFEYIIYLLLLSTSLMWFDGIDSPF